MPTLRRATRADIGEMHRIRLSVGENKLTTTFISEADYGPSIEDTGRGWVVDSEGVVVAFAIANRSTGSIWALFVHPDHERRGHGSRLHDSAVEWLWSQGRDRIWLTTEQGTRAQRFYESRGWEDVGRDEHDEIRFELTRANQSRW